MEARLAHLDSNWDRYFSSSAAENTLLSPKSDVIETENRYQITIDMPGVAEQDVEISLNNGILTIAGKKEHEQESKHAKVYRMERSYGDFQQAVRLPDNIDEENIQAHFNHGVLKVILPKTSGSSTTAKKIKLSRG